MRIAQLGTWMTALLVVSALGAFAPGALASEPNCRTIESAGGIRTYDTDSSSITNQPRGASDRIGFTNGLVRGQGRGTQTYPSKTG
jgi:hypothetical protein